jgi:hypothetical protein
MSGEAGGSGTAAINEAAVIKKILFDNAVKILFIVVPLMCAWVLKLEVNRATSTLRISSLETALAAEQAKNADITDIKVEIGKLQAKQDAATAKVDKIYGKLIGN